MASVRSTRVRDSAFRLAEQDRDGIVGEVMYPSLSMFTFAVPDNEIRAAAFRRHNDWVFDYCTTDPDRLIGIVDGRIDPHWVPPTSRRPCGPPATVTSHRWPRCGRP